MARRLLLLAAAAACAAAAVAYASSASRARSDVTSLTIYSHATKLSLVDADGNKQPSPGDLAITTYGDYDRQGGTMLGSGIAVCTLVSRPTLFECTGSDALPGGGRVFEACTSTKQLVCTVSGGTGPYRFVHGEAVAKQLDPQGKNLLVTFALAA